jgi:DNA-directed RNA polymerase specialized sigma24 family protein
VQSTDQDIALLAACQLALRQHGADSDECQALFQQYYEQHYQQVYLRAMAWETSAPLAAEIADDTLYRVWQWLLAAHELVVTGAVLWRCFHLARIENLRYWYGRIPAGLGQQDSEDTYLQNPSRLVSLDANSGEGQAIIHATPEPLVVEAIVLELESDQRVLRLLATLTQPQRATVFCRTIQGKSVAETAALLGRTEHEVKHDTQRGLARIAQLMKDSEAPN